MSTEFGWDVLISYSSIAKPRVRDLASGGFAGPALKLAISGSRGSWGQAQRQASVE
jgi:hypothetical protein